MSDNLIHLAQTTKFLNGAIVFDFPGAVAAYVRSLLGAREEIDLEVTISEAGHDHTRAQERGYHAMIAPYARHRGETIDQTKQLCLAHAFGTLQFFHQGTGQTFELLAEPRSSKLNRREYSHLIESTMELAASDQPPFICRPPDEYRAAREAVAKQDARRAEIIERYCGPRAPQSAPEDRAGRA